MSMLERVRKIVGGAADAMRERLSTIWSAGTARVRTAAAPTAAAARGRYQKLERRERVLVQIAGALVALFIVFNLIYLPIQDAIGGLGDRILERQHDAVDVAHMMRTYQRLRVDLATMRSRTVPAERRLLALLGGRAGAHARAGQG